MSRSNFVTVSGGVPGRYEPPPPAQDYDDGVH